MLAVKNADGTDAERYAYDKAGNMVKKMILRAGRAVSTKPPQSEGYQTTTFTFDGANQLVSSTTDGVTTKYAYDAAGRLVKEGLKTYRYGYLDKVLSVTDGKDKYTYDYHVDGQLASANYGDGKSEDFLWDGLALVKRGSERFINEPHVGNAPQKLCFGGKPQAKRSARRARKGPRGNPVVSSSGTSYFNDVLGTTLGSKTKGTKYSAAALTAFGESLPADTSNSQLPTHNSQTFYTGKPYVAGLGHAFLFRNYRAGLAKWQTADPLGYPDGWNALAYCGNGAPMAVDLYGCTAVINSFYDALNHYAYGDGEDAIIGTGVMLEAAATPEYQLVIKLLESILGSQPYVQTSGSFSRSSSFSWEQGLILGRNTMHWAITINWVATPWEYSDDGSYMYRRLTGSGIMFFNTFDDWDFNVHEGDTFLRTAFGEMIPAVIASLYSIIVASNIGEAYHMTGEVFFGQQISAIQKIVFE